MRKLLHRSWNHRSSSFDASSALLTSNDRLRPKLDAFFKDHKAHFRLKWIEGAAAVSGIAALLAIFWLVWEAFS